MNTTRAQKIYDILKLNGGRLHINDIYFKLLLLEDLKPSNLMLNSISATCRAYNFTHRKKFGIKLFKLYEDGEKRGYISILNPNRIYHTRQVKYLINYVLEM